MVATSTLELGIDMAAVDLVVLVESPATVAQGLQRVGRAGHQVGMPSRAKVFPKHRGDLLEAAVVVRRMEQGLIEETHIPANPLDVLAQQLVAMVATGPRQVDEVYRPGAPGGALRRAWAGPPSRPSSTCSPAAIPPTSSPSCAPASSGTGPRAP